MEKLVIELKNKTDNPILLNAIQGTLEMQMKKLGEQYSAFVDITIKRVKE